MKVFNFFRSFFVFITMLCMMNLVSAQSTVTIKLDTAGVYPYPTSYNFCTSDVDSVYLIQPTISGMTGVRWYIPDFPTQPYYNDTVLIVPQYEGMVQMNSNQGYMRELVILFYEAPPSHATFEIFSGGDINTTNDTAYMCGMGGLSLGAYGFGGDAVYMKWLTNGSFFSSDNPITITQSTTYVFEHGNPCGITTDTIVVIQLPTVAPVWTDTSFCNTPVSLTLDPGPGWDYLWNTGATTQTLSVDTAGVYSVTLSNVCSTGGVVSIAVTHQSYPLPDLDLYSQIPALTLCQSEVAILDPYPGYTYDTYKWYQGGTVLISNQPTLTVDYALGGGYYLLEVTQGNCVATSDIGVSFYPDPQTPTHCVSSFDPLTGKNMTVFDVMNEPDVTDYVLFYKQGSVWIPLDTVAKSGLQSHTLYDDFHDPNQQSFTYAAFAMHSCGNLSPLGDWHKTIRIAIFQDVISNDYVLQIMDDYETMGGYTPDSYTIWIDSLNDGHLSEIGILNGGNSSFTISAPVNGAAYYASVDLPWTCNNAKLANISYSNKRVFSTSSVSENQLQSLTIYPNPATNQITISGIEPGGTLRLYDLTGKLLVERKNIDNTMDVRGIAPGSYVLEVRMKKGVVRGNVVVE